jgi:hypothetical protein
MSYRTKVLALSTTLAFLLLVYAAGLVFSPERRQARAEAAGLLAGKPTEAASIELSRREGDSTITLSLSKKAGSWVLLDQGEGLPVQGQRVASFLEALAEVKRLSPRSDGTGDATSFGLAPGQGSGVLVKDSAGKTLADFRVGGYGPTGKESYLSLGGKKTIYAMDAAFGSYLTADRSSWLDLRLFTEPPKIEEVESLALSSKLPVDLSGRPAKPFAWLAKKKDGSWKGSEANLDAPAVEGILRSILKLSGEDIATKPPVEAFATVLGRIELGLSGGRSLVIEIGASAGQQRYYLRSPASPYVYLASAYSLMTIMREEGSLLAKK